MTSKNVGDVLFFFLGGGGGEQIGYSLKIICHKLVMVQTLLTNFLSKRKLSFSNQLSRTYKLIKHIKIQKKSDL